jgi:hypothetical protein
MTEQWHALRIQISPSGMCEQADICGRCGAIVFFDFKDLHDDFHSPLSERAKAYKDQLR